MQPCDLTVETLTDTPGPKLGHVGSLPPVPSPVYSTRKSDLQVLLDVLFTYTKGDRAEEAFQLEHCPSLASHYDIATLPPYSLIYGRSSGQSMHP